MPGPGRFALAHSRRPARRRPARVAASLLAIVVASGAPAAADDPRIEAFLESYFETFPSRATAEGRHDLDAELEDLSPERLAAWSATTAGLAAELEADLAVGRLAAGEALDAELVLRFLERQRLDLEVERRPATDPLFWTGTLAQATVFLLVRDDAPAAERLAAAAARAERIPRLAGQARAALGGGDVAAIAPELARLAARQASAAAGYYRGGFAAAAAHQAPGERAALEPRLAAAGAAAADALDELAAFLEELAGRATGDFRLGERYAERFKVVTGVEEPVAEVLAKAELNLEAKLREAAAYGRGVWRELLPNEAPPLGDRELVARLFAVLGDERAPSVEAFVAEYRELTDAAIRFVREREVVSLPEPFPVWVGRSPGYLLGQSVGGVYPPGPYSGAESPTLLFLPTPPDDLAPEARDAFFRDFNHAFNVMITPHEIVPGHALQLVHAARHPRKARAIFADGVYVEGWGTFCERLMLDLGWGDARARLAHLKKQMENLARTIVDIRVHTGGMSRDEVIAFVRDEALQDEQFAANMWRRTMTSSPQLTFYDLGYRQVRDLFEDVRRAEGDRFELRRFMDGMMELGPVPVRHYRERMLGAGRGEAR